MVKDLIYLYDDSLEGMIHAVSVALSSGCDVKGIYGRSAYVPTLFDNVALLTTDRDQAREFFDQLCSVKGVATSFTLNAFLGEEVEAATHLYRALLLMKKRGRQILNQHTNDSVRYLHQLTWKVGREAHRFKGLIRFSLLQGGLLYGPFEPDYNIVGYVADHFRNRLKNHSWILHDLKRDLSVFWNGVSFHDIGMHAEFTDYVRKHNAIPVDRVTQEEKQYRLLWRVYHSSTAIEGRINCKLQRQRMPKKYWKYLVEMK